MWGLIRSAEGNDQFNSVSSCSRWWTRFGSKDGKTDGMFRHESVCETRRERRTFSDAKADMQGGGMAISRFPRIYIYKPDREDSETKTLYRLSRVHPHHWDMTEGKRRPPLATIAKSPKLRA